MNADQYEQLLSRKEMEIAALTEQLILTMRYSIVLQDDLRATGVEPSHNRWEIEKLVFNERHFPKAKSFP